MKPLTPAQIKALAITQRQAFDAISNEAKIAIAGAIARAREAADPFACVASVSKTAIFDEWRHAEIARAMRAFGKREATSLKELTQGDYLAVKAHFTSFFDKKQGEEITATAQTEERKRLIWLLRKNCEDRDLRYPEYPAQICAAQYKTTLDFASNQQLRRLLFTVRSRRKPQTK